MFWVLNYVVTRSMLHVPPMVDYKRVKSRERGPSRSRVHDDIHALRHKPL